MKKLFLFLIISFLSISIAYAGSCTQPGYQYCWEETYTSNGVTAHPRIYWQFEDDNGLVIPNNNAIGNLYIKSGYSGTFITNGFGLYNVPSWDAVWARASCDSVGNCEISPYDFTAPDGFILIASAGETFTKCVVLIAYDTNVRSSDGWWAATAAGYGWVGSGNCVNIRVVSPCTPNCACAVNTPVGQTCPDGCGGVCQGTCTPNWQCGSWSTCSGGTQTRTCTDLNNCGTTSGKPATTQSCTCNTVADTDCNNIVSFQELTTYANQWVAGTVTFTNLIQAATAWTAG